jgi:hypothetical protein
MCSRRCTTSGSTGREIRYLEHPPGVAVYSGEHRSLPTRIILIWAAIIKHLLSPLPIPGPTPIRLRHGFIVHVLARTTRSPQERAIGETCSICRNTSAHISSSIGGLPSCALGPPRGSRACQTTSALMLLRTRVANKKAWQRMLLAVVFVAVIVLVFTSSPRSPRWSHVERALIDSGGAIRVELDPRFFEFEGNSGVIYATAGGLSWKGGRCRIDVQRHAYIEAICLGLPAGVRSTRRAGFEFAMISYGAKSLDGVGICDDWVRGYLLGRDIAEGELSFSLEVSGSAEE